MGVAIIHEGKTDRAFLEQLIEDLKLDKRKIKYYNFTSKSNFFKIKNDKYKDLKLEFQAQKIDKILFVIDADYQKNDDRYGGYQNTERELKRIIKELKIEKYSEIYIVCDPATEEGYLESLILSTIPDEHKECISSFLNCSNFSSKENHKAILNQIYKMGYPNVPYNFSHPNFDNLKNKLKALFK